MSGVIELDILVLLFFVAIVAGFVDAIAGGGGLICLPALLAAGLSPAQALATNKLQGSFSTFAASINFVRKGHVNLREMALPIALTFVGSVAGTLLVQVSDPDFLRHLIPYLLVAIAIFFIVQPRLGEEDARQRITLPAFAFTCGFSIGFYDGFFGPGTGTFFAIVFVTLLGFSLMKATAHAKVLNFTSNIASFIAFAIGGQIVWMVGLVMAVGQFIGGWMGANMVISRGSSIIRPLLIIVSLAMTARIIYDTPGHPLRAIFEGLF